MMNPLRKLLLCSFVFLAPISHAITLYGDMKNNKLTWSNGINYGGDTTVPWQIFSDLYPTTFWKPGMGGSYSTFNLKNVNNPSEAFTFPIQFVGMQYKLPDGKFNVVSGNYDMLTTFDSCKDEFMDSSIAMIRGLKRCVSKGSYKSDTAFTPFLFARPIFSIDEVTLKEELQNMPEGVYQGSVLFSPVYEYLSKGGVMTWRQFNQDIFVIIDSHPNYIKSVKVIPTPMKVSYENDFIKGNQPFSVLVTTNYDGDVRLVFPERSYQLKKSGSSTINYNLSCTSGCDSRYRVIVEDGELKIGNIVVNNRSEILASFEVYSDAVEDGTYLDMFMVTVEPTL